MGVLPSGFIQNPEIIIYQDRGFTVFINCRFILKIPPVRVDEGKSCCLFCVLFQEGEEGLEEFKVFFLRQSGYAFPVIVGGLFVKVWRTCPPSASPSGEAGGSKMMRSGFSFELVSLLAVELLVKSRCEVRFRGVSPAGLSYQMPSICGLRQGRCRVSRLRRPWGRGSGRSVLRSSRECVLSVARGCVRASRLRISCRPQ